MQFLFNKRFNPQHYIKWCRQSAFLYPRNLTDRQDKLSLNTLIQHNNSRQCFSRLNRSFLDLAFSRLIKTYFLNKDFDMKNPICIDCPQIECVYSLGNYRIPDVISMCAR